MRNLDTLPTLRVMSVAVENTAEPSTAISGARRLLLVVLGGGLVVLLGVARSLAPSPNGFGTHQGLGLPPCTFQVMFHMRCPSCGMTTSWAHLTRGDVPGAVQSNVGGLLLGVIAMLAAPWLLVSALLGRWWFWSPSDCWALSVGGVVVVVTLLDWAWRLYHG